MNYSIEVTSYFKKQAKRLLKKYPLLKSEILQLISLLEVNPQQGTPIGNDCFKIRLAISSKGKSGGGRIITHIQVNKNKVFLVSIYDKSEQDSLDDKELSELLKMITQ